MDIRPTDSPAMIEASDRTPVHIEQKWFTNWGPQAQTDFDDYFHIITYADGSTEERWTIPNEWLAIERASKEAV